MGAEGRQEVARKRDEQRGREIDEYVRRVVDAAPPLTGEQRARLADLMRPYAQLDAQLAALDDDDAPD